DGLAFKAADKANKRHYQQALNSEMLEGRVFFLENSPVIREMSVLAWNDSGLKERDGQPNHHCDATLYVSRESLHWQAKEPDAKPQPGTPEFEQRAREERFQRVREAERKPYREEQPLEESAFIEEFDTPLETGWMV